MSVLVSFLARFDAMNAALVESGFPAISDWWRQQIGRFFAAGRRRWVIRAGRRAGKSSTLARLAVAWALWGTWSVPAGDVAVIPFVSVDRDEASARLRTIAAVLRALGVSFEERTNEIEITGARTVLFRVTTCSTRGTVGFTSIACFCDEVARWESRDIGANPAKEVVGSLSPTMATQPSAFLVLSSSPWGTDDFHAEQFDLGDTAHQVVSFAPTWLANPTLSEQDTHALEPDPKLWQREYAGEPGSTLSLAFDVEDVRACIGRTPLGSYQFSFLPTDMSSLRNDACAWLEGYQTSTGELVIEDAHAFEGVELRGLKMSQVVDHIVSRAHALGVGVVYGDQREDASLISMFGERGIAYDPIAWSDVSKDSAVKALRRLMRDRELILPNHEKLIRQCETAKCRLMPSGRVKYELNGLDYASALVTLAHRVVSGHIGAPMQEPFDAAERSREITGQIAAMREADGWGGGFGERGDFGGVGRASSMDDQLRTWVRRKYGGTPA